VALCFGVPKEGGNSINDLKYIKETHDYVIYFLFRSGGIERDWVGVPRMLFENSNAQSTSRCACVKLDSKEYEENKAMLREYDGCAKNAIRCIRKVM